jgi:hypothetical protein
VTADLEVAADLRAAERSAVEPTGPEVAFHLEPGVFDPGFTGERPRTIEERRIAPSDRPRLSSCENIFRIAPKIAARMATETAASRRLLHGKSDLGSAAPHEEVTTDLEVAADLRAAERSAVEPTRPEVAFHLEPGVFDPGFTGGRPRTIRERRIAPSDRPRFFSCENISRIAPKIATRMTAETAASRRLLHFEPEVHFESDSHFEPDAHSEPDSHSGSGAHSRTDPHPGPDWESDAVV